MRIVADGPYKQDIKYEPWRDTGGISDMLQSNMFAMMGEVMLYMYNLTHAFTTYICCSPINILVFYCMTHFLIIVYVNSLNTVFQKISSEEVIQRHLPTPPTKCRYQKICISISFKESEGEYISNGFLIRVHPNSSLRKYGWENTYGTQSYTGTIAQTLKKVVNIPITWMLP